MKKNISLNDNIIYETSNDEPNMKYIILNMVKSNQELQKQIIEVCKNKYK